MYAASSIGVHPMRRCDVTYVYDRRGQDTPIENATSAQTRYFNDKQCQTMTRCGDRHSHPVECYTAPCGAAAPKQQPTSMHELLLVPKQAREVQPQEAAALLLEAIHQALRGSTGQDSIACSGSTVAVPSSPRVGTVNAAVITLHEALPFTPISKIMYAQCLSKSCMPACLIARPVCHK